jgi:hypothetical protein
LFKSRYLAEHSHQFDLGMHMSLGKNASQMRATSIVRHTKAARGFRKRAAARDLLRKASFGGCEAQRM